MADYALRLSPGYSERFGYGIPAPLAIPWPARMARGPSGHPAPWPLVQDGNWLGPRGLDPWFARRRARVLASANIAQGTRVMDVGCVLPALRFMLARGCTYLGVDLTGDAPSIVRANWPEGELPALGETSLITVLGALEFVSRPTDLMGALNQTGRPIMLTYHARDDTGQVLREELGWQNHLTRAELLSLFEQCGLRPQVLWRFDGYQSLFRLTPE
ncbi:MAG: class I SAM-dependent methyltransferase [Planctomycetota bacterium]